ncbi:MAG: nitronate monooxygenase [Candidatus Hydrogenedentota bacterium]|nr:MAG: nitronate monooxygenase [Candidatus Hydrogenedentota bacterium]
MGAGVSNWNLARIVASTGQLGVVSGTAIDVIVARRLQDGDPGGAIRRALEHFPYSEIAERLLKKWFRKGGRGGKPYKPIRMHSFELHPDTVHLCVAANFCEVWLAKQGHNGFVGINYLEKLQIPHLPSLFGAMLAGVDVVIMGAGIPREIPSVLAAFESGSEAEYPVTVTGACNRTMRLRFRPSDFFPTVPPSLKKPRFLPIVSSLVLAKSLLRSAADGIDGFVIEGPTAGGHNAPPRGLLQLSEEGEPIYGERDAVDLALFRRLGKPFWLAGSHGRKGKLAEALEEGAAGIQVGTAFALCRDSGLDPQLRRRILDGIFQNRVRVFTDPVASPTGFPFKVTLLPGTLSDDGIYEARTRICDLGYLRENYLAEDGKVRYRCPSEPVKAFLAKGGEKEAVKKKKCLCNALMANIGMGQIRGNGAAELPLVTLGDEVDVVRQFCTAERPDYSATDVIEFLLRDVKVVDHCRNAYREEDPPRNEDLEPVPHPAYV